MVILGVLVITLKNLITGLYTGLANASVVLLDEPGILEVEWRSSTEIAPHLAPTAALFEVSGYIFIGKTWVSPQR